MNSIAIPQKIKREIDKVSAGLGVSTDDFALNAILYYMKRVKDKINLKSEMEAWENAGAEDFLSFEKTL
jgi:hypothetical protein